MCERKFIVQYTGFLPNISIGISTGINITAGIGLKNPVFLDYRCNAELWFLKERLSLFHSVVGRSKLTHSIMVIIKIPMNNVNGIFGSSLLSSIRFVHCLLYHKIQVK